MLIEPMPARNIKIELFEQSTQEALQDELQAWLDSRTEEVIIGISFDADVNGSSDSYRAEVLYTE